LEPGTDRTGLESAFALLAKHGKWLRAERELGFWSVADPAAMAEHIEGPGVVLDAAQLLDAASLL